MPEGENIDEMDAIIRKKTAELTELKEEQKGLEGSLRSWTSKLRNRYHAFLNFSQGLFILYTVLFNELVENGLWNLGH